MQLFRDLGWGGGEDWWAESKKSQNLGIFEFGDISMGFYNLQTFYNAGIMISQVLVVLLGFLRNCVAHGAKTPGFLVFWRNFSSFGRAAVEF